MASINNDSVLKSQISDQDPNQKTTDNIFSVRNIVIGLVGFIFAVSCILTYAFKDQIFGSEDVLALDENDSSIENSVKNISEKKNIANNDLGISRKQKKVRRDLKESHKINAQNDNESGEVLNENVVGGIDNSEEQNDVSFEAEKKERSIISGSIIFINESASAKRLFQIKSFSSKTREQQNLTKLFKARFGIYAPALSLDYKNIIFTSIIGLRSIETISLDNINIDNLDNYNIDEYRIIYKTTDELSMINPSFNSDESNVIFKKHLGDDLYRVNTNCQNYDHRTNTYIYPIPDKIKEFEKYLNLKECKYTPDGTYIVCLLFNNDNFLYEFHIIKEYNNSENDRIIKLNFNSIQNSFHCKKPDTFKLMKSFSISPDSSKIVLNLSFDCSENSFVREIYVIDFDGNNKKKVYEAEISEEKWPNFVLTTPPVWSPDSKFIIFSDIISSYNTSLTLKTKEIDSESAAEELKDKDGNSIEGHVLGWSAK